MVTKFDQAFFNNYLHNLQNHLFPDKSIDEIVDKVNNDYRPRRFVAIYVLKDKETFHHYYQRRKELNIELLFNTVISALFHQRDKKIVKQELIDLLCINEEMAGEKIEGFAVREFDKDLNVFIFQFRKQTGEIFEMFKEYDRDHK